MFIVIPFRNWQLINSLIDPPTYEEAMRSTETTNEDFVPKYPTYKRGTKYASQDFNL